MTLEVTICLVVGAVCVRMLTVDVPVVLDLHVSGKAFNMGEKDSDGGTDISVCVAIVVVVFVIAAYDFVPIGVTSLRAST